MIDQTSPAAVAELLAAHGAALLEAIPLADPGRVALALRLMARTPRDALLGALPRRVADELREMMSYPSESAGALMDTRVAALRGTETVGDALRVLRARPDVDVAALYIVDQRGVLDAEVPTVALATASDATPLALIARDARSVDAFAGREEIVALFEGSRLPAVPVIDARGRLIGVIRHAAILGAAEAVASADLQAAFGASREETALSPVRFAVRQRLPWLEINLLTAFLAAFVVGLFEGTIAQVTALAVLLPVVAGQSGNSGMQALAVTMRGLALREVRLADWPRLVVKESGVGLLNGLAVAATTMIGVFLWSRSLGLVAVIGLSMTMAMVIAGVAGTCVPLVLRARGHDPAQSSSIVLTTVTDVCGFLSFLGLATLLIGVL